MLNGHPFGKPLELTKDESCRRFGGENSRRSLGHFRRVPRLLIQDVQHLLDRLDTRDRFFSKWKSKSNGAEQLAVYEDRTSAHSGDDTGALERSTRQADQDHVLLWGEVLQHAQNLNIEPLDCRPLKNCLTKTFHPLPHFVDGHNLGILSG